MAGDDDDHGAGGQGRGCLTSFSMPAVYAWSSRCSVRGTAPGVRAPICLRRRFEFKQPVREAPQKPVGSPSHGCEGVSVPFDHSYAEGCSRWLGSAGTTHLKVSQRPGSLGRYPSMALLADILLIAFLSPGCVFRSKSALGDTRDARVPLLQCFMHKNGTAESRLA